MRTSVILVALVLGQVSASRDSDEKSTIEVSSRSHFVAQKEAKVLADVQKHKAQPAASAKITAAPPSQGKPLTPAMRAQVADFAKLAIRALQSKANPGLSHQTKNQHVQAALAGATQAMQAMASTADLKSHPEIAAKLDKLQLLTAAVEVDSKQLKDKAALADEKDTAESKPASLLAAGDHAARHDAAPASLLQKSEEGKTATKALSDTELLQFEREEPKLGSNDKITPEMQASVRAFSKIASQAFHNEENPNMEVEERATAVQAAMHKAVAAMSSVAGRIDLRDAPELAKRLARLQSLTAELEGHSLMERDEKAMPRAATASNAMTEDNDVLRAEGKLEVDGKLQDKFGIDMPE